MGRLEQAEEPIRRALEGSRRVHGPDHPETLRGLRVMGFLLHDMGRYDEAERAHLESIERVRRALPDDDYMLGFALRAYARLLASLDRYAEAEKLQLEAYEILAAGRGADHPWTKSVVTDLVATYGALERPEQAAAWRARLTESGDGQSSTR
jgi:tetratricopeptide (TPR) repeat protein